jgi:hypothetical protein
MHYAHIKYLYGELVIRGCAVAEFATLSGSHGSI